MGFTNTKNSYSKVVFYTQKLGFAKGWMANMNAINLPEISSFKDPFQIPLLVDLPVQAQIAKVAEEEEDKEGCKVVIYNYVLRRLYSVTKSVVITLFYFLVFCGILLYWV